MSPQTANNSPFPLQTKVTTRGKITYTSPKKKKKKFNTFHSDFHQTQWGSHTGENQVC